MNIFQNKFIQLLLKLYIVAVLIAAVFLSPLALSAVPVVILLWYLYLLRWPVNSVMVLLTGIFLFFAINLLFSDRLGAYFPLIVSLPALGLVLMNLEDTATTMRYMEGSKTGKSRPTSLYITILACIGGVLGVAVITGNLTLLLAGILIALLFGCLGVIALRTTLVVPVETNIIQSQIIAGNTTSITVELSLKTRLGGLLFLRSPYEWMSVNPSDIMLRGEKFPVTLMVTPELSGPSVLKITGQAVDRWGLFRSWFELEAIHLFVIPRARYAAWLAERYISRSNQGTLPLITNLEARRSTFGLRQGIEYYGSQLYQPGDSLKNIDWKHSVKYNELITKEFIEFNGQSAILLINLSVGNEIEADKLAYNIIITALSLAQNDIPVALAVYNHEDVKLTTVTLNHQHLVARALQVAREMVSYIDPVRYLNPPDIGKLRNNIRRISTAESDSAQKLRELLQFEFVSLTEGAKHHPATKALQEALIRAESRANIVSVSCRNHDVEALAYNAIRLAGKGNAVIEV